MNIDDIAQKIGIPDKPIVAIFNLQKKLMERYDEIERQNGFDVPEPPYNLDDTKVQARIKDMFWRTTEELAEAIEIIPPVWEIRNWQKLWGEEANIRHFFEELADALHFLVETSIIAGLDSKQEVQPLFSALDSTKRYFTDSIKFDCLKIVLEMGIAANILKNKPWKLTQMSTDIAKFKNKLITVWSAFVSLLEILNCSEKEIYILYAKKNLINQWRQKTNY